jgi:hypothetical protein
MSPILGIIASSFRSAAGPDGAYDALATVTVPSGGLASVTFAGIPNTYKHLQIRGIARSNRASTRDGVKVTVNGNTSNFTYHNLYGEGTTTVSQAVTNQSEIVLNDISGANASANIFGAIVIDVVDYASTSKYKTIRSFGGSDVAIGGLLGLSSGFYFGNTNAITSITLQAYIGTNLAEYSSFTLYGVK